MALFEAFFVARATPPGQGGSGAAAPPRLAPFCRFAPPGVRANGGAPTVENAVGFCFPLGADSVKPSAYLVTAEFTFTLTGGDGGRLHGVCRRTHDPTFRPAAGERGTVKRWPQVLCILSPHCWQPFFSKALEVVEQLLAPHAGCEALPPDAPAALFLASLPAQLAVAAAGRPAPPLGAVLRLPLPLSGAPVVVDRMRRALAPPGQAGAQLGLSADAIELEVGAGQLLQSVVHVLDEWVVPASATLAAEQARQQTACRPSRPLVAYEWWTLAHLVLVPADST